MNVLDKVSRALEQLSMLFRGEVELRYATYTTQEGNSRRAVCALQRLLERHPGCIWTSDHLGYAKQKLMELEHKRDKFYFHGFRSRWSQKGDKCTKEFF